MVPVAAFETRPSAWLRDSVIEPESKRQLPRGIACAGHGSEVWSIKVSYLGGSSAGQSNRLLAAGRLDGILVVGGTVLCGTGGFLRIIRQYHRLADFHDARHHRRAVLRRSVRRMEGG
jgi:hypothetical protein